MLVTRRTSTCRWLARRVWRASWSRSGQTRSRSTTTRHAHSRRSSAHALRRGARASVASGRKAGPQGSRSRSTPCASPSRRGRRRADQRHPARDRRLPRRGRSDREPEEQQRFLLATSILTRMSAPVCDAILEASDSGEVRELERTNSFVIALDDTRSWYRYHHLFGELLRAELDRRIPSSPPCTSRAPPQWHEQDGGDPARPSAAPASAATSNGQGGSHWPPSTVPRPRSARDRCGSGYSTAPTRRSRPIPSSRSRRPGSTASRRARHGPTVHGRRRARRARRPVGRRGDLAPGVAREHALGARRRRDRPDARRFRVRVRGRKGGEDPLVPRRRPGPRDRGPAPRPPGRGDRAAPRGAHAHRWASRARPSWIFIGGYLALALADAGRWTEARETAQEARALAADARLEHTLPAVVAFTAKASVLAHDGDFDRAAGELATAVNAERLVRGSLWIAADMNLRWGDISFDLGMRRAARSTPSTRVPCSTRIPIPARCRRGSRRSNSESAERPTWA